MSEKVHPFPTKRTLTTTPAVWFLECKYCQTDPTTPLHEKELLAKVSLFCKKSDEHHFREFLTAEFDTLDHARLTPAGQIEVLSAVHDKTGCDCLSASISDIVEKTHEQDETTESVEQPPLNGVGPYGHNPPASQPTGPPHAHFASHQTNGISKDKSPRPSTMLDRLKIGPKGQGKSYR